MPDILRIGPYRFYFWSRENNEPSHIHVKRDRYMAKYWLDPEVRLAKNQGYARHELTTVRRLVEAHRTLFLEKWHEHFDQA